MKTLCVSSLWIIFFHCMSILSFVCFTDANKRRSMLGESPRQPCATIEPKSLEIWRGKTRSDPSVHPKSRLSPHPSSLEPRRYSITRRNWTPLTWSSLRLGPSKPRITSISIGVRIDRKKAKGNQEKMEREIPTEPVALGRSYGFRLILERGESV